MMQNANAISRNHLIWTVAMHASQSLQVDLGAAQRELEDEKSRGGVRMRELEEKIRDGI